MNKRNILYKVNSENQSNSKSINGIQSSSNSNINILKNKRRPNKLPALKHSSSAVMDITKIDYGHDQERVNEDMLNVMNDLSSRQKEYKLLKDNYNKVAQENIATLQLIKNFLSECKEIEEPLERRDQKEKESTINSNKLLTNKLKEKIGYYLKELHQKNKKLDELKKNERLVRFNEIEDKLKDIDLNLNQTKKNQMNLEKKLKNLHNEYEKLTDKKKAIIHQNNYLKIQRDDYLHKIKKLEEKNKNLDENNAGLEEKVKKFENEISEICKSIDEKINEINSMNSDLEKYNEISSKNEKIEKEVGAQEKLIKNLKEQIDKKNRQIVEAEKMIKSFSVHKTELDELENETHKKNEEMLNDLRDKRAKKETILKEFTELNKKITDFCNMSTKSKKFKGNSISIQKQLSFNLNIPMKLEK